MMKTTLLITLSLVTAIKTEQLDCSIGDINQIDECIWDLDGVERYTCEHLEAQINCIESTNGNCGQSILPFRSFYPSNEPCYHQKFDQYFNQDGQCSFEDFRQLYKSILVVVERNHQGSYDDFLCLLLQTSEDVIKQTKQNCLGFFQDQASLFAQMSTQYGGPPTPMLECLKAYLPKGGEEDEDLQEEKPEFPTVNKLIQELVLIQKLLSNKP